MTQEEKAAEALVTVHTSNAVLLLANVASHIPATSADQDLARAILAFADVRAVCAGVYLERLALTAATLPPPRRSWPAAPTRRTRITCRASSVPSMP